MVLGLIGLHQLCNLLRKACTALRTLAILQLPGVVNLPMPGTDSLLLRQPMSESATSAAGGFIDPAHPKLWISTCSTVGTLVAAPD